MAKKVKDKTVLEKLIDEGPKALDVRFILEEVSLKKGIRRMKFSVGTQLKKTDRFYRITLYFDDEPYRAKIEANLRLIGEIESDITLFDKTKEGDFDKKNRISKIKEENKLTNIEIKKLREQCIDFEFTGESEKVEYNKETLTLRIDKETLTFINNKETYFMHYKMILKPIL